MRGVRGIAMKKTLVALGLCLGLAARLPAWTVEDAKLSTREGITTLEGRIVGAAPGPVLLTVQYDAARPARPGGAPGPQAPGWLSPGQAPGAAAPRDPAAPDAVEVRLPGADRAELRRDFDSRMVEQRQLPEFLSTPFSLELWKGSTLILLRYNSFRESFAPGVVEDAFSAPAVAALASRDGLSLATTPLGTLAAELLARREPLARTGDMRLGELRVKVDGQPLKGVKIEGGSDPRAALPASPGKVELEVRVVRDTRLAYADRLVDGALEPVADHWVTVEVGGGATRLAEVPTGADGWARLAFTAKGPEKLALFYHPKKGATWGGGRLALLWRWGRPEEAWLDKGAAPIPAADPAAAGKARLAAVVGSLCFLWSPDDAAFKDPGGSSGICGEHLVVEALEPVLAALGPGFTEPKGALPGSLDALRARVAWCRDEVTKYGNTDAIFSDLGALPGDAPFARVESVLNRANHELEKVAGHWSRPAAWAGVVVARWLQGPVAKADPEGRAKAAALLATLRGLAAKDGLPHAQSWSGKTMAAAVGPVKGDWLAHLMLGEAFARGGAAFEAGRKDQLKRFLAAFGAADLGKVPLAHQALAARMLRVLVERHKATALAPALAKLEGLVAQAWAGRSAAMDGCERLAVLRAFATLD